MVPQSERYGRVTGSESVYTSTISIEHIQKILSHYLQPATESLLEGDRKETRMDEGEVEGTKVKQKLLVEEGREGTVKQTLQQGGKKRDLRGQGAGLKHKKLIEEKQRPRTSK